jgi:glutamine amidotransferase
MCRLLGVFANKLVDFIFSLDRFQIFSELNPDGWGVGWYEGDLPKFHKEKIPASDERSMLPKLSQKKRSQLFIAHVRRSTGTVPAKVNSHPFCHDNWLFAHNGSVQRAHLLSSLEKEYSMAIKGETDSEVFFYYIMQQISKLDNVVKGVREAVNAAKEKSYSGLNFLLSNGQQLFAFRGFAHSPHYYTLYWLKRDPSEPGPFEFLSKETKLLLRSKSLKSERAALVCSEKLTQESWSEIKSDTLLEIRKDLSVQHHSI